MGLELGGGVNLLFSLSKNDHSQTDKTIGPRKVRILQK